MAANYSFNQDYGSDDEEEHNFVASGRDATIFVIDCSASMFQDIEQEDDFKTCLFIKCLTVIERHLLNKIISNNKDLVSVVLYNTEKSPELEGSFKIENCPVVPKNCAILIPLLQIEASTIKYVKNMKASDDLMGFDTKFGHSKDAKISDILWLCSSIFGGSDKQIRVPTIMWYTDDDHPHQVGSGDQRQALQRAKDLQQLHIDFQFFPLKVDFNGDLFYKEFLCQILDLDFDAFLFPTPQLDERKLLLRMFRRAFNKRAIAYLSVELSEKAKFGVGIYSYIRKSTMPKATLLSRSNREEIVSKRTYKYGTIQEGNDGAVENVSNLEAQFDYKEKLEPNMAIKFQQCGGEKIKFTPLEAYEIKQVMEPKIKVLGFKPASVLSDHNHIKCPYFIYPAENRVKNSTVFFRTLWERCLADNKIVICIFTMKLKSYPRLVALVPQEQTITDDGEMIRYDGFRMEFIPFTGDIRDLSEVFNEAPEADDGISLAMKKIIGKLRFNYAPITFENPAISKIYTAIEQQVFEEDIDEELRKDSTLPDVAVQDERIWQFIDELEESLVGFTDEVTAPKRKASDLPSAPQRKKVSPDEINQEFVLEQCKEGNTKNLTVPILRGYLELNKITGISKLTKPQLVEKILEIGK